MQRSHPSTIMILVGARDVAKSGQLQMHEITTPDLYHNIYRCGKLTVFENEVHTKPK